MTNEPTVYEGKEPTIHESQAPEFDDKSLWEKLASAAGKAGREVVEIVLKLYYALIDSDTPLWARSIIIGALAYFISPVDAIPDVIIPIGYTDDAGVLAAAVAAIAAHIKPEHVERAQDWVKQNLG